MRILSNEKMTLVSKHQDVQNGVKIFVFSTGEFLMLLSSEPDIIVDGNNEVVLNGVTVYNKNNVQFMGLCV